jgi:hypothetical protein
MKRLQISLEPELDEALGREADREGVSKAEIVRRCLREEIETPHSWEDDPLFKLFGTGTGGLRPGETIDDVVYGPKDPSAE